MFLGVRDELIKFERFEFCIPSGNIVMAHCKIHLLFIYEFFFFFLYFLKEKKRKKTLVKRRCSSARRLIRAHPSPDHLVLLRIELKHTKVDRKQPNCNCRKYGPLDDPVGPTKT